MFLSSEFDRNIRIQMRERTECAQSLHFLISLSQSFLRNARYSHFLHTSHDRFSHRCFKQ